MTLMNILSYLIIFMIRLYEINGDYEYYFFKCCLPNYFDSLDV